MAEALQKSVGRGFNLGRWSFFSCRLPMFTPAHKESAYTISIIVQKGTQGCRKPKHVHVRIQEWSTLLEVVWSASIHGKAMQMQ